MRSLLLGSALALLLAGCGGTPTTDPSPTPSPTPSASPSVSAPAMPEAAKAYSNRGAKAFVRHYIELINYAGTTGEFREIHVLSDAGCQTCRHFEQNMGKIFRHGGHVEGGNFVIQKISIPPDGGSYRGGRTVDVTITFPAQQIVRGDTGKTENYAAGDNLLTFILIRRGGWQVGSWSSAK